MPEKKRSRPRFLLPVVALAGLGFVLWVGLGAAAPPSLSLRTGFDPPGGDLDLLGPASTLVVEVGEPGRGAGPFRVEWRQGEATRVLAEDRGAFRSAWTPWAAPSRPQVRLELALDRDAIPDLKAGLATLRVIADRASGFLRSPDPAMVERGFTVRLTPPSLAVASTAHYVSQGGCEVVVYEAGEGAVRSGVQAGDWFFPGHPLPGGGPGHRFALFAVPYDLGDVSQVRLVAADPVGNQAERRFVDRFFPVPPGRDTIRLSDEFLERVVPDILSQTPELRAQGTLLDQYLMINRDLRRSNAAELRQVAARSGEEFRWRGAFLALRNAQATGTFAEHRIYLYDGREVDQQDHLGFDLASTRQAPVQAANSGVVVRVGWFGIYGNVVILDHGYGLQSLYGHLSSIAVAEGDAVSRGQEIARTGETGLAGGDHLHVAMLLMGLPVNPREWWDDHWLEDRLRLKLGAALPG